MKAYLIDFENVKSKGLAGIDELNENDKVVIFYSENSETITFDMHQKVIASQAQVEYLKVRVGGKNALDFQLCTLAGFLVAKEIYSHIFIISNDKGFDKLHDFWESTELRSYDCIVFRSQTIFSAINYAQLNPSFSPVETNAINDENETDEVIITQNGMFEIFGDQPIVDNTKSEEPVIEDKPVEKITEPSNSNLASKDDKLPIEILQEEQQIAWEMPVDTNTKIQSVSEVVVKKVPARKTYKRAKSVFDTIRNSLVGLFDLSVEELEIIKSCVTNSNTKAEFYSRLDKTLKETGREIYKVLKISYPTLKEQISTETSFDVITASIGDSFNLTGKEIATIQDHIKNSSSKEDFHNCLVRTFKDDGGELYKILRPKYLNLKGLIATDNNNCVEEKAESTEIATKIETTSNSLPAKKTKTVETNNIDEFTNATQITDVEKSTTPKSITDNNNSAIYDKVANLLESECTQDEMETISDLIESTETKQRLYLSIVKKYRKERGCLIYNHIKPEYNTFVKLKEEVLS